MRILSVVSVQVEKKAGYGYLKEIIVRLVDQNLYKFKEGDFLDLHLNDIEDMMLLIAQNKLFNLDYDVIVDFVIALKMFTRGLIVKNRVEDVQLVRKILRERLLNFKFGYNKGMSLREWTKKDKRHTSIMVNKIDDLLLKRRIRRSLELLVGGRKTEMDKRLLQRTV
ncbi:hypothetical protein Tco_0625247 [Tanacetum coccineum]|uniref:Uncharacterized protein n=1 Tax=Tanacetum coccineum TaxID=301880 RepID=A0ABQ4WG91_9ASTR